MWMPIIIFVFVTLAVPQVAHGEEVDMDGVGKEKFRVLSGRVNDELYRTSDTTKSITVPTSGHDMPTHREAACTDNTALASALQLSAIIQQTQAYLAGRIEHVQDRLSDKMFSMGSALVLLEKSFNQYRNHNRGEISRDRNQAHQNITNDCIKQLGQHLTSLKSEIALVSTQHFINKTELLSTLSEITNKIESLEESLSNAVAKIGTFMDTHIQESNKQRRLTTCLRQMRAPQEKKYQIIYPTNGSPSYLCDTDGGWTVMQRRVNGHTNFYRDWSNYKHGFGSLDGDFWLGLDRIHDLTSKSSHELLITMIYQGRFAYAQYSSFYIAGEADNYRMTIGTYSGTAGDSLTQQNNMGFSTFDSDNDEYSLNCAIEFSGAWWYKACHSANLNGLWGAGVNKGPRWDSFTSNNPVTMSEMKIRAISVLPTVSRFLSIV